MSNRLRILSLVIIFFALTSCGTGDLKPAQSKIFLNGTIITMDSKNSIVEAVAVSKDRIVAAGTTDEIKKLINKKSVVIDLQGKVMLPGFIDAHSHFPGSGLQKAGANLNSPPLGGITCVDDAIIEMQKRSKDHKEGKWFMGFGYDDTLLAEKRHLTRYDLDRVSTKYPIYAMHISGHFAVLNSYALNLMKITSATPSPDGGVIHKDAQGNPTGLLEETAKEEAYNAAIDIPLVDKLKLTKLSADDYVSKGVTTAQNGYANLNIINSLSLVTKLGINPMRLVLWPNSEVATGMIDGKLDLTKKNTKFISIGAVKLIADGSIQGYTGYLSTPYYVPYKGDANYRGYPTYDREELARLVTKVHKAGYQLAIHGNGDAAIDDIIYAFDSAQKAQWRDDPRMILIHSQMVREDQLDKMTALGITPSFFSAHIYYWGERHKNIFMGPEKALRMSPASSAVKRNLPFTTHLDTPVVPMNPLLAVWCCVNRKSYEGNVIGEDQTVSVTDALKAVTITAAWQMFQEDNRGSIETGKFADFVILDRNPYDFPAEIKDIQVLETIVGGGVVYRK